MGYKVMCIAFTHAAVASVNEVVWFPHDNPAILMQELVWESGGPQVKWVFFSTPADGNGVLERLRWAAV